MRSLLVAFMLVALCSTARAGDPLKPYAGTIVIAIDAPPATAAELPAFLAANAVKSGGYDLIKGPPWPMHLVGVLAKDTSKQITLSFADKGDPRLAPLVSIPLSSKGRVVIAHTEATTAAGFAAGKTYVVRLMLDKTVLAKAEVTLRE